MGNRFPFLIGTVRTYPVLVGGNTFFMFPFLIGTVRTKLYRSRDFRAIKVSIPHRYGKNAMNPGDASGIPLFPFLIGTVRTVVSSSKPL